MRLFALTSILILSLSLHSVQFLVDVTDFHFVFSDTAPEKNERKHIKLLLVSRVVKIKT